MNDILFELLKLIVMIAVLLIMRYAIPWIRSRIGVEKMAEIEKWAEKAVLMAQQVYWEKSGEERKEIVTKFLQEMLIAKNISISEEQLNILIEAAVKQMKIEEGRDTAPNTADSSRQASKHDKGINPYPAEEKTEMEEL